MCLIWIAFQFCMLEVVGHRQCFQSQQLLKLRRLPGQPAGAGIWNLGTPEFIYEFMKHMNSCMKKSYEFIGYMNSYMNSYIWIHIHMNSYNHYMNSYMKWLYEFIYIWIHIWNEYMSIWIHIYEFKCTDSEFMRIWIHVYEFKCMDSKFIYEFINIWIQI